MIIDRSRIKILVEHLSFDDELKCVNCIMFTRFTRPGSCIRSRYFLKIELEKEEVVLANENETKS